MKRKIKNHIWGAAKSVLGTKRYEALRAAYNLGYTPNIDAPRTFSEKIMHKKIYHNMDYAISLADKYAVRDYVKEKAGETCLNQVYFAGTDPRQIPWDALPQQFVIKTTHGGGGGGNIFVHDKSSANRQAIEAELRKKLNDGFGFWTNEPWYMSIPKRFLIEEMMQDENGRVPSDYKFFCFHGKCHYIQVDSDRFGQHTRSFYDTRWNYQDFSLLFAKGQPVSKPDNLDAMLEMAEKLAEDFDFVRVDLYSLPDGIRFGELTFSPGSGWEKFTPQAMDEELGNLWNLKAA